MPNRKRDIQRKCILLEFQGLRARGFLAEELCSSPASHPLQSEMAENLVFRDQRKQTPSAWFCNDLVVFSAMGYLFIGRKVRT